MLFDVLIIVIIALFATFGYINGFTQSIAKIGGWILAFLIAFFFHGNFEEWLKEKTEWFEILNAHVYQVCSEFVEKYTAGIADVLPDTLEEGFEIVSAEVIEKIADTITKSSFTVFVFVGMIILIVIIFFILSFLISRRTRDGIIGGIDGFGGLIFGILQGVIAVVLIAALLVPIAHVVSPEVYSYITVNMNNSNFAKFIYENNPLLFFIGGVLPDDIDPLKWIDLGKLSGQGFELKDWGNLL